jgi:hypothetical protein
MKASFPYCVEGVNRMRLTALKVALAATAATMVVSAASAVTTVNYTVSIDGNAATFDPLFSVSPVPGVYQFRTNSSNNFWVSGTVTGSPAVAEPNLVTNSVKLNLSASSIAHQIVVTITQAGLTFAGTDFSAAANNNFLVDPNVSGTVSATLAGANLTSLTTSGGQNQSLTNYYRVNHGASYDQVVTYTFNVAPGATAGQSATSNYTIAAVPEAATWAMMLVGFGGIGAALRSGRRSRVSFAA